MSDLCDVGWLYGQSFESIHKSTNIQTTANTSSLSRVRYWYRTLSSDNIHVKDSVFMYIHNITSYVAKLHEIFQSKQRNFNSIQLYEETTRSTTSNNVFNEITLKIKEDLSFIQHLHEHLMKMKTYYKLKADNDVQHANQLLSISKLDVFHSLTDENPTQLLEYQHLHQYDSFVAKYFRVNDDYAHKILKLSNILSSVMLSDLDYLIQQLHQNYQSYSKYLSSHIKQYENQQNQVKESYQKLEIVFQSVLNTNKVTIQSLSEYVLKYCCFEYDDERIGDLTHGNDVKTSSGHDEQGNKRDNEIIASDEVIDDKSVTIETASVSESSLSSLSNRMSIRSLKLPSSLTFPSHSSSSSSQGGHGGIDDYWLGVLNYRKSIYQIVSLLYSFNRMSNQMSHLKSRLSQQSETLLTSIFKFLSKQQEDILLTCGHRLHDINKDSEIVSESLHGLVEDPVIKSSSLPLDSSTHVSMNQDHDSSLSIQTILDQQSSVESTANIDIKAIEPILSNLKSLPTCPCILFHDTIEFTSLHDFYKSNKTFIELDWNSAQIILTSDGFCHFMRINSGFDMPIKSFQLKVRSLSYSLTC